VQEVISLLSANDKLVTSWTAILAVFISLVSIIITVVNVAMQRAHNRKSVLPIGTLSLGDYENQIFVRLRNDGVGPMIIDNISVHQIENEKEIGSTLIDLMPKGVVWRTFVRDISGRAFAASKDIDLILFEGDSDDARFIDGRQRIREALSNLRVKVHYHSIYGEKLVAERALDWFGRVKNDAQR
jgi:hypothetical protein